MIRMKIIYLMLVVLLATIGMTGCGTSTQIPVAEKTRKSVSHGAFSDPTCGCSFRLPAGEYRIERQRFSPDLPADKIRHSIRIYTATGNELAQIDLYDNPKRLRPEKWVRQHREYLLNRQTAIRRTRIGTQRLPTLVLDQPKTPQTWPTETVVIGKGERIAVITRSKSPGEKQTRAYRKLLSTFSM